MSQNILSVDRDGAMIVTTYNNLADLMEGVAAAATILIGHPGVAEEVIGKAAAMVSAIRAPDLVTPPKGVFGP